jgi:hypothetical protein
MPPAQELSPSGHCPHHETPRSVDRAIDAWVSATERAKQLELPVGEAWTVQEDDGRRIVVTHVDGRPRNVFERFDAAVWRLKGRGPGERPGAGGRSGAAA